MRHVLLLCLLVGISTANREASAQSMYDETLPVSSDPSLEDYRKQLLREQYETAIMRERAKRAYLEHQAQVYEYQRQQHQSALERFDQQQQYYNQSNTINTINQAANAAANIGWQIQMLSRGRAGW